MVNYSILELELCEAIGLSRRPVVVTFLPHPPEGVRKFAGKAPSGCSFFSIAAGGMAFYTVAADHYNCAVGCYAYNLPLPEDHAGQLEKSFPSFSSTCSVGIDDIRSVPRKGKNPEVVVYAPLGETPVEPDIVVFVVRPLQCMFLQEAAMRRQIAVSVVPFGRPTCMSLHSVMEDNAVTSAGCMGNRVYNALGDDEMYMLIPGRLLKKVADEVQFIVAANLKLAEKYVERRNSIETVLE